MAPDDPELAHVPGGSDGQQVPVPLPARQQERPGLEIILESEHSLKQCCHELFKLFEIEIDFSILYLNFYLFIHSFIYSFSMNCLYSVITTFSQNNKFYYS